MFDNLVLTVYSTFQNEKFCKKNKHVSRYQRVQNTLCVNSKSMFHYLKKP